MYGRPSLARIYGTSSALEQNNQPTIQNNVNELASTSQSPLISFRGVVDNNTAIPPDVASSIGPTSLVPTQNNQYGFQLRDGIFENMQNWSSFWNISNAFDPRSVFDPYSKRFLFSTATNAQTTNSQVLIGYSQSIEPKIHGQFSLIADSTGINWADYPQLGFTNQYVVITVNLFGISNGAFNGTKIFVFDKASLYNGTLVYQTLVQDDTQGAGFCPAWTYDASISTLYLVQLYNSNNGGTGYLRLTSITGNVGSVSLNYIGFLTASGWGSSGSDIDEGFAPQFGTNTRIDTGDDRIQNVVYRSGQIWCSQTIFIPAALPTRSSIQWWNFTPNLVILQRALIDDSSNVAFFAYPCVAINRNLDMIIGFCKFSALQYASAGYSYKDHTDPPNTTRPDAVLKAGEGPYTKDFGSGIVRWGDFTTSVVDSNDDYSFWVYSEYAGSNNNWENFWGRIGPVVNSQFGKLSSDFNGTGKSEIAQYRNGIWFIRQSDGSNQIITWGIDDDIPIPSRTYSASQTSVAVWRPSNAEFLICVPIGYTTGTAIAAQWGINTDFPLCIDWNGDGIEELGIYRSGAWFFEDILGQNTLYVNYGLSSDIPVHGDWMNKGKTQIGIWRPNNGVWFTLDPTTNQQTITQWGQSSLLDVPVVGDYLGTGYSHLVVWRASNGTWFIKDAITGTTRIVQFGILGDIPLEADFDGDGISDIAIFRPTNSTFYIINSSNGQISEIQYGISTDIPTTAYNTYRRMQMLHIPISQ